jgi:tetratricopeptide (TPR) repeat protein
MKRTIKITLGICFALFLNVSAQTQEKISEAEKAIKNKEYSKALTIAKEILEANNPDGASRILIQLREKNFIDKKLFETLGDAYSKMNVGELAISNYEDAEKLDSLDVSLKFKTAELFYKLKKYTDAANKYLKIISLDPKNSKAYLGAATILFQAKIYGDAATMFEKYIAIESTLDAYRKICKAFIEIKKYDKTYKYAVEGLEKFKGDNQLLKYAAIGAFGSGQYGESAKYYSSIPDSLLTVNDMKNAGTAFQQIKADSTAIVYYEKVVKRDSTQSGLFMTMANNYFSNKNYEMAAKFYSAKIKTDSTYEPAYRYLGFAYYAWEKYDLAKDVFKKAIKLVDTTFTTNYYLAQAYARIDSVDEAAEQYTKVLKLTEGREGQYYKDIALEAVGNLGQRAYLKKNYAQAITYYRKANQLKPNDWKFMESLGACYQLLQNYDEAIRWYCQTLRINSKSEAARKGLRMMSADDCVPKGK